MFSDFKNSFKTNWAVNLQQSTVKRPTTPTFTILSQTDLAIFSNKASMEYLTTPQTHRYTLPCEILVSEKKTETTWNMYYD